MNKLSLVPVSKVLEVNKIDNISAISNNMLDQTKIMLASNWLQTRMVNGENGIVIEKDHDCGFEIIQNFIDSLDDEFKTPVTYYRAFPQESAAHFLDTLGDELISKLGKQNSEIKQSLIQIIQEAGLKMIVLEDIHLHPVETINNLLDFFNYCGVAIIFLGSEADLTESAVLSHSQISKWSRYIICDQSEVLPRIY